MIPSYGKGAGPWGTLSGYQIVPKIVSLFHQEPETNWGLSVLSYPARPYSWRFSVHDSEGELGRYT